MHLQLLVIVSFASFALAANDATCGTKGPLPPHLVGHLRIIHGTDARAHEFPWQCSLQIKDTTSHTFVHTCGAAILNDRWLMTAAHCCATSENTTRPANRYRVICGAHDLAKPSGTEVNASVAEFFLHPALHVNWSAEYDFALIKLSQQLPLTNASRHLGSVCLPNASEPLDTIAGAHCIATGWGISSLHPAASKTILQKATFTVLKQTQCIEKWGPKKVKSLFPPVPIKDCHLCIERGDETICHGDSGGPLNCWVNGRWYTYGVASMVDISEETQCIPSKVTPNVYARATVAAKWIWSTIARHA